MIRLVLICAVLICAYAGSASAQSPTNEERLTPEEHFAKAKEFVEDKGDFFSAMLHLKPAADGGLLRAQVWYARFLDDGEDNELAEKYYQLAVAQGDPEAKLGLAVMHISGDAAKPDLAVARQLIQEGAEEGYRPAIIALAAAYIQGGLGMTPKDMESAAALWWITKAADLGDLMSLRRLESIYRTGGGGVTQDIAKADQIKAAINKASGATETPDAGRRRRK
jgi:TPR repeat protein